MKTTLSDSESLVDTAMGLLQHRIERTGETPTAAAEYMAARTGRREVWMEAARQMEEAQRG